MSAFELSARLFLQLAVILLACRVVGFLAQRVRAAAEQASRLLRHHRHAVEQASRLLARQPTETVMLRLAHNRDGYATVSGQ